MRVGDWRIVYEIEDGPLVVLVLAMASRGEVYKGM
ncbi:MAG: type II toxin-antitoxin system RelE family toxin [Pikeienuella sp.]